MLVAVQLQANGCGQQVCNSFDSASIQLDFNMQIPAILNEIFSPKVCISFNLPQIWHIFPGVQRQVLFKQLPLKPVCRKGGCVAQWEEQGTGRSLRQRSWVSLKSGTSHSMILDNYPLYLFFYIFSNGYNSFFLKVQFWRVFNAIKVSDTY